MIDNYIYDKSETRYIVFSQGKQYFISDYKLKDYIEDRIGVITLTNGVINYFLNEMFEYQNDKFEEIIYIISYTYNDEFKYLLFNTWYEAVSKYNYLTKLGLYDKISTNFKIDEAILKAVDYNNELEKNIKYEKVNSIPNNRNLDLLD
jgi:hypothetical protein